jgi:hypothetical protein
MMRERGKKFPNPEKKRSLAQNGCFCALILHPDKPPPTITIKKWGELYESNPAVSFYSVYGCTWGTGVRSGGYDDRCGIGASSDGGPNRSRKPGVGARQVDVKDSSFRL